MAQRVPYIFRDIKRVFKPLPDPIPKWNVVRGDLVEVIGGKEKGKQGKIIKVDRKKNFVYIEGLQMQQRRYKPTSTRKGGIVMKPGPIHYSNVNLVDPTVGKPTRVGYMFQEDGTKVRFSKKTGTIIPKPELHYIPGGGREDVGPKDTPIDLVLQRTVDDKEIIML